MKALIPSSPLYNKSFPLPFSLHKQIPSHPHQFHLNYYYPPITISMAACIHSSRTTDTSNRADDYNKYLTFCRTGLSDCQIPCRPIIRNHNKTIHTRPIVDPIGQEDEDSQALWLTMKDEAISDVDQEPILSTYYFTSILSQSSLGTALANHLAIRLSNSTLPSSTLFAIFTEVLEQSPEIIRSVEDDLRAAKDRDPACISYVHCFLNFKGFLACQSHRVAHKLWKQGRKVLALLIQNRVSEVFAVDIHPGARIGSGILLDHATGVVVGETAVIGNNVSILHNVTLGGTGKAGGDRHPKIGDGVLIGAGTCILGNIRIGDGAKIGAGSVVVKEVPARTTAVGNPARLIGGKENPTKLDKIPSFTMDHTSHISEWSDYVI